MARKKEEIISYLKVKIIPSCLNEGQSIVSLRLAGTEMDRLTETLTESFPNQHQKELLYARSLLLAIREWTLLESLLIAI